MPLAALNPPGSPHCPAHTRKSIAERIHILCTRDHGRFNNAACVLDELAREYARTDRTENAVIRIGERETRFMRHSTCHKITRSLAEEIRSRSAGFSSVVRMEVHNKYVCIF